MDNFFLFIQLFTLIKLSIMQQKIRTKFKELFNTEGSLYTSPGRINLIGEHTDYNGGFVFPGAVDKGMIAEIKPNGTGKVRAFSIDLNDYAEFGLTEEDAPSASWARYIFGVCREIIKRGGNIQGFDTVFAGDVPLGAGMSSSAALESTYAFALNDLFSLNIDKFELAKIGQATEHNYCGVNCGIMDQFAIGMGTDQCAIYLDTNTLKYDLVPLDLKDNVVVIMNTNKRRELADSKYNERRAECETAVSELQEKLDIQTLGELDFLTFDAYSYLIKDENRIKRARHVVLENQRTLQARKALEAGDLEGFGRLMNASHVSLEYDYEVTGLELDTLAHTAWEQEGVLGARMTGAGFGGCAIALVNKDKVEDFKKAVGQRYEEVVGYAPSFYIAEVAGGSRVLD